MAFKPVTQPPPVDSDRFLDWAVQFWRDSTKRAPWTPAFSFTTPGNLSVSTTTAIGDLVQFPNGYAIASFFWQGVPTFTTSTGAAVINGLPLVAAGDVAGMQWQGSLGQWQGITKANYTQMALRVFAGLSLIGFVGSGSAQSASSVAPADIPSGGTVILAGSISFRT